MKKTEIKLLFLFMFCILTMPIFSQDSINHIDYVRSANKISKENIKSEELILINLGGGTSLPTANFKNATSPLGGALAKPGYIANVSATIKLSDNFGFNLGYLYQSNKYNEDLSEKIIKSQSQGIYATVSGGHWLLQGGFAGLSYYIKSNTFKNLTLFLNASSGYVQCTSPDITTTVKYPGVPFPGQPSSFTQEMWSSKTWAVAFLCGAGLSYKLSDYTGIYLSVNYLQSTPEFKDITTTSSMPGQTIPPSYIEQKITAMHAQVGLIFYANRYVKK